MKVLLTLAPEANDIPLNCSLAWKRLSASPPVAPMMLSPREAMISMSPGLSLLTLQSRKLDIVILGFLGQTNEQTQLLLYLDFKNLCIL